jgi:hypothetical protein
MLAGKRQIKYIILILRPTTTQKLNLAMEYLLLPESRLISNMLTES